MLAMRPGSDHTACTSYRGSATAPLSLPLTTWGDEPHIRGPGVLMPLDHRGGKFLLRRNSSNSVRPRDLVSGPADLSLDSRVLWKERPVTGAS